MSIRNKYSKEVKDKVKNWKLGRWPLTKAKMVTPKDISVNLHKSEEDDLGYYVSVIKHKKGRVKPVECLFSIKTHKPLSQDEFIEIMNAFGKLCGSEFEMCKDSKKVKLKIVKR